MALVIWIMFENVSIWIDFSVNTMFNEIDAVSQLFSIRFQLVSLHNNYDYGGMQGKNHDWVACELNRSLLWWLCFWADPFCLWRLIIWSILPYSVIRSIALSSFPISLEKKLWGNTASVLVCIWVREATNKHSLNLPWICKKNMVLAIIMVS